MSESNHKDPSWGPVRARVENYIARIERYNPTLNAVWTPTFDSARDAADAADIASSNKQSLGLLHGVIVALKDNIDTQGVRTTSGSKLFEHYVPTQDATVWRRLKSEGAILIGKLGLHECVFGANSQNEWFGGIRNPWSVDHIPGGSSGGSGAAVAADLCDVALGTDTGGSVRIPSALCGIAGLRPTMGAVSNHGVRPISPHLDTVGPMAWRVEDVARCFSVMQQHDPLDDTSRSSPNGSPAQRINQALKNSSSASGLRVGVPDGFFQSDLHPSISSAFKHTQTVFKDLGATLVPVDMSQAALAAKINARIIVADAADYYKEDIENRAELFSHQVMRRMSLGFEVSGIEYAGHMRFMFHWQNTVDQLFDQVDVILTPTLRAPAPRIDASGDLLAVTNTITPFPMAWALAAVPNLALPIGFSEDGLPVSCQLATRRWHEHVLFSAGMAFQSATDFHKKRPEL